MTPQEALNRIKKLNCVWDVDYDEYIDAIEIAPNAFATIQQALDDYEELKDSFEALENKCAMYDYWRDNCLKNDRILEILKSKNVNVSWLKESKDLDTYNSLVIGNYQLSKKEYKTLKGWLK